MSETGGMLESGTTALPNPVRSPCCGTAGARLMLESARTARQNPVCLSTLREGCGRYELRALTDWQPCALLRS